MGRTACTEPQCLYKGALYLTVELYLYPPMGRTACTEPQCLYKGDLYLFTFYTGVVYCRLIRNAVIVADSISEAYGALRYSEGLLF
jgi:hypothetical protein